MKAEADLAVMRKETQAGQAGIKPLTDEERGKLADITRLRNEEEAQRKLAQAPAFKGAGAAPAKGKPTKVQTEARERRAAEKAAGETVHSLAYHTKQQAVEKAQIAGGGVTFEKMGDKQKYYLEARKLWFTPISSG